MADGDDGGHSQEIADKAAAKAKELADKLKNGDSTSIIAVVGSVVLLGGIIGGIVMYTKKDGAGGSGEEAAAEEAPADEEGGQRERLMGRSNSYQSRYN